MQYNEQEARKYMQAALNEAQKAAALGEVPIGCVIVKDHQIIGRGYNFREKSNLAIDHAEIRAIKMANQQVNSWRLEQCALFVTLEPCPMCAGAILNSRISEVYYGAADSKAGMAGTLADLLNDPRLNHQVDVQKNILKNECLTLLQDFFSDIRKNN
ncbi:tRNA adenosine(34) deaminase TadA [Ligilactobacillus sp. LYQ135]